MHDVIDVHAASERGVHNDHVKARIRWNGQEITLDDLCKTSILQCLRIPGQEFANRHQFGIATNRLQHAQGKCTPPR